MGVRQAGQESPGFNAGRGLKLLARAGQHQHTRESPGFNAGRGLKQSIPYGTLRHCLESPGFNAGRGLKRHWANSPGKVVGSRPVLMPGVD